jgi:glycosyltransferase involved in cell wall biosynthesis
VRTAPPVSLGMPVFDGEAHLAETLRCLADQTFGDYELLISDNASTDATAEICHEFMRDDPRISYHRNERNLGAAANYNLVFHKTSGRYFKWVSYDDLLAPEYLARCTEVLDDAPESVALCYPRAYIIDGQGEIIREHDDDFMIHGDRPSQRLREFARRWNMCNPCFGLHRRSVLAQTRLVEPYISSDVTLLAEIAMRGEFWELPERLFYRRIHATSSRQGELSLDETGEWFAPGVRPGRISPRTRIFFEILRSIVAADLGAAETARSLASFTGAWAGRRIRVRGGRYRRALEQRVRPLQPAVSSVPGER